MGCGMSGEVERFSSELRGLIAIQPGLFKGGCQGTGGQRRGVKVFGKLQAGLQELGACGYFEVAVACETSFVTTSVGAEGLFGWDVTDGAIGEFDGECYWEAAVFFEFESEGAEVFGGVSDANNGTDL